MISAVHIYPICLSSISQILVFFKLAHQLSCFGTSQKDQTIDTHKFPKDENLHKWHSLMPQPPVLNFLKPELDWELESIITFKSEALKSYFSATIAASISILILEVIQQNIYKKNLPLAHSLFQYLWWDLSVAPDIDEVPTTLYKTAATVRPNSAIWLAVTVVQWWAWLPADHAITSLYGQVLRPVDDVLQPSGHITL